MERDRDTSPGAHAHDESASRGAPERDSRRWFHFWFSTYGTWIRGDARGFRDHDHRIHSSGDYRRPPPPEEHRGLRRWVIAHMHKAPVRLGPSQRRAACAAIVSLLQGKGVEVVALAVATDHVHGLGKFPADRVRQIVGHAKRYSSHALRHEIPGAVWARKWALKPVRDRDQQRATYRYIVAHGARGAHVWTFRDRTG